MTVAAWFECMFCPWDGDAMFRYPDDTPCYVVWDCPECGRENDGEVDEIDPDYWRD